MTSTNHFRGRRLSRSLSAPISPRHPHHQPFGSIAPPNTVTVDLLVSFDRFGTSVQFFQTGLIVPWIGGESWWLHFTSDESYPALLTVDHDPIGMTVLFSLLADTGSGLNYLSQDNDGSGMPLPWDSGTINTWTLFDASSASGTRETVATGWTA